jgi:hypothetical protein
LEMVRKYILLSQHVGPGLNCLVKISNTIQILRQDGQNQNLIQSARDASARKLM